MKNIKTSLLLALVAAVGLSASALSLETVSNDVTHVVGLSTTCVTPVSTADVPEPIGEGEPPGGYGGGGESGGGTGGSGTPPEKPGEGGGAGSDDSVLLTGAYPYTSETNTLFEQTLESTTADQNVILAMTNAYVTVSNCVLNKTGDMSSEDNSNFYAVNAVVAAKTASTVCIANSTLNSNAKGANCLFASGEGSTIYAYGCKITSTKDSSRGLDATYEGTVIASKMSITTTNDHCAAFATDRGNGSISVTDATMTTAGQGSPLIYSTGIIEVNGVTGTATGAQIAGIEGLSTIRIKNSDLTGSGKKASEPVANGVIIYQSNSGDYTEGTATFEVSDSTLSSAITNSGAMFYITHSEAVITVQNTELEFDTDENFLLKAAGNDGSSGWGDAGTNGAVVVFTAIDQNLAGNVSVDGISSLDMYLTNSTYTGTFVNDTTYTGDGDGIELFLSADSKWIVTADCTLKSLTAASGATIVDGSGKTVSIVEGGTTVVEGDSTRAITVSDYASGDVVITNAITSFEISRTAFNATFGLTESGGGSSGGGATDHDGWVYYCCPHPPDNAIVKVRVADATEYGTPDRDHKYCLDGYWDGTADPGVVVHLLYVTTEGYLFADGCTSNTWDVTVTNNTQEIYPPEDVVAIKTQAKSGRTYYLTLKEAVDAAGNRSKITLNDNVTLEETLTVTNSITLDLNTNTVTLADALTEAFRFTAKATVSNGTISGDGCLLYIDDGARVTITNGCAFTCEKAAVIYCSSNGTITIASDTYKDDAVVLVAPDGYFWENGQLVEGTQPVSVTPGVTSEAYEDAQSATNAAAVINANKANCIEVPTGVEGMAKATYLTKIEATVADGNCVVVDLTPAAQSDVQDVVDAAVTNETVFASLVSTNASETVTITTTTPGLYYWIEGGTEVQTVTDAGAGVLSTNGGAVELSKPALDSTKGKAFFRISAGVSSP